MTPKPEQPARNLTRIGYTPWHTVRLEGHSEDGQPSSLYLTEADVRDLVEGLPRVLARWRGSDDLGAEGRDAFSH
ncbi:hypothetical protein ABTZ59_02540 [Streptomyces sp. NPDC094034]|uniref:hypothetical protein n=1 Tax=Streptomyces sp. NPDC094034 TaxID=3155309 RepID=UPI00332A1531